MTELDHSSVASLLAGLDRGGVFRFKYDDGTTSPPWRPKSATVADRGIGLGVEYADASEDEFSFRLSDGRLVYSGVVLMTVVADGPPSAGFSGSADDRLRRQLDDNLRGTFA